MRLDVAVLELVERPEDVRNVGVVAVLCHGLHGEWAEQWRREIDGYRNDHRGHG